MHTRAHQNASYTSRQTAHIYSSKKELKRKKTQQLSLSFLRTLRNDIGRGRGRNRCDTFVPKRTIVSGRGRAFTLEALFALQEREADCNPSQR